MPITKFFTCRQLPLPLLLWTPVSQSQTMLICNRCRLTHACLNVRSSSKGRLPQFSGVPKAIHGPRSFGWKEAQTSSGNAWLDGMNSSGFWFVMPLTYPLINKASCTTLPKRVLRLSFRLGLTYRLLWGRQKKGRRNRTPTLEAPNDQCSVPFCLVKSKRMFPRIVWYLCSWRLSRTMKRCVFCVLQAGTAKLPVSLLGQKCG